ncbi:MAG: M20/M25/M40 family metallo-hydrolase [Cyanobacteriota bacterium]
MVKLDCLITNINFRENLRSKSLNKTINTKVADIKTILPDIKLPVVNSHQAIVYFTGAKKITLENLAEQIDRKKLEQHVKYLASDELAGRLPDTEGSEKAQEYIISNFKESGLRPFKPFADKTYKQHAIFEVFYHARVQNPKTKKLEHDNSKDALNVEGSIYRVTNILGYIPAKTKTDKYVFLTAHYDHLGRDHDSGKVFTGADDNASGVAAMLEIARVLGKRKYDKNIVFVATSGEETKCLGSKYLAQQLNINGFKDKVEIINMDCLAAKGKYLTIEGGKPQKNIKLEKAAIDAAKRLKVPYSNEDHERNYHTDAAAFDKEGGFPAISLVWAYEDDFGNRLYNHKTTDTAAKANYDGIEKSTKVALGTVFSLATES